MEAALLAHPSVRQAAVAAHGEPVPVPALVEAALRPDLELLAKLRKHRVEVARFLGRAYASSGEPVVAAGEVRSWLRRPDPDADST